MNNKPTTVSRLLDFLGLFSFFAVYYLSDKEYAVRNASISIIIVTLITFGYFYFIKKQPMPRLMLGLNIFTVAFALPSAYFNSLEFIKWKIVLVKMIFFIAPLIFLYWKKINMIKYFFSDAYEYPIPDDKWNLINNCFIVTAGIALVAATIAGITLDNDSYVNFKTFFLPIVSSLYIIPFMYYGVKYGLENDKNKNNQI